MVRFGKTTELSYLALIADVVRSRELPERALFQAKLQSVLRSLNRRFQKKYMAAPLGLTAGDEIQGLFKNPAGVVKVLVELSEAIVPVRIVCGLGYGQLTTGLDAHVSLMDGPCFHRARSSLKTAVKEDTWALVEGLDPELDLVLSTIFRLMDAIRSRWTQKQVEYVREGRRQLQKDVAAKFRVSPSVISESLKAASFEHIQEAEFTMEKLLDEFGRRAEVSLDSAKKTNYASRPRRSGRRS